MKILARILRMPLADLLLVGEAFLMLGMSWLALRCLPFSTLAGWVRRPGPGGDASGRDKTVARVGWAILAVAQRMPDYFVCFPQCLAAHAMLRRRGIASVLLYGVNRSASMQLRAHTWLKVGEATVVGGEAAPEFTVVSTFPS